MFPDNRTMLASVPAAGPAPADSVDPVFITCGSPFDERGLGKLEFKIDELFSFTKLIASEAWIIEAEGIIGDTPESGGAAGVQAPVKVECASKAQTKHRRGSRLTTAPGRKKRWALRDVEEELGNNQVGQCRQLWLKETHRKYAEKNSYPTVGTAFGLALVLLMFFAGGLFYSPAFRSVVYTLIPS